MAMAGVFPWWVALVAVLLMAAVVVWANQRETASRANETRALQAEARAATAEAVLNFQAQSQSATATALAYASSPVASVDRSLSLLLAAERDPGDQRLRALSDAFGPAALATVRPEVEHLLSGGLHLAGESGYELSVLETTLPTAEEADVHTRERWTYDERNADGGRARCLVEMSDQTYVLRRAGSEWRIADIQFAASSRADCVSP